MESLLEFWGNQRCQLGDGVMIDGLWGDVWEEGQAPRALGSGGAALHRRTVKQWRHDCL